MRTVLTPNSRLARARGVVELARRNRPAPAFVEFRQVAPEPEPDGMPGNLPCDCRRIVARSAFKELAFDRLDSEDLAAFQERVWASIPRTRFWLILPEPIIVGPGDAIPVPSPNVPMIPFSVEFASLFSPARYKCFYGGRAAAKTWSIARALVLLALFKKIKVGCFRELMNSIPESVHLILKEQIAMLGYSPFFEITNRDIRCPRTGSAFLFKGLRHNVTEVKSTEGITHCWIEEGQIVSEESWQTLTLTIREESSEIWISFNPAAESDPTYQRFVLQDPPRMIRQQVNWNQNPFFNRTLNEERIWTERNIPQIYEHVWMGSTKALDDAVIFAGKFVVDIFEAPVEPKPKFYFGADFGWSVSPSTLVRAFITGNDPREAELWIDFEAWRLKVEITDYPTFYEKVPGSREGTIFADCAEGPTIDYIRRQGGYAGICECEKGKDSVRNGIQGLLAFTKIHIHERCKRTLEEFRTYSWERDRKTNEVTTEPEDAHNHVIDALRYALQEYFAESRGSWAGIWKSL